MRKPFSSFATLALAITLSMLIGSWAPLVWSQDAPIEPVNEDTSQELVVNDQRYSIDLEVPIDANPMQEADAADGTRVLVKPGGSDPLAAVYVPTDDSNQRAVRYLPQFVGAGDAVCPADQVDGGTLSGDGVTWVAAAPETDLRQEDMAEIGQTDEGMPILGIQGDDELVNLFVANNSGQGTNSLVRYTQVNAENTPTQLANGFAFAGQEFTAAPGAVPSLDGLTRVGCAGLFPVMASAADQPFGTVALDVNGAPASFEGAPPAETTAAPSTPAPSTPEATEAPATAAPPTEVPPTAVPPTAAPPTEVPPTEVPPTAVPPTEVPPTAVPPTEVPPTEVPPTEVPPTEVPPTAVPPTEVPPTEVPSTEVPPTALPPTEVPPTAVPPTEAPAEAAVPTEAAPAAVQPTEAAPVNVPAVQDVAGAEEGEVEPTAVPPTPDPAQPTPTPLPVRPTPTPVVYQAPASVATASVQVASTPMVQTTALQCAGVTGSLDDDGIPDRLPRQIQYVGQSYAFISVVQRSDLPESREEVSCIGPFVVIQVENSDTLYLGIQNAPDTLYAFETTTAFTVQSQTYDTQAPDRLAMPDTDSGPGATYRAAGPLVPTSYSSISLVLYVSDVESATHDRILGHSVSADAFGEYVPEGAADPASQEVIDKAATYGIPSQFVIGTQRYVLVGLWTPFGTTTNGWLTLYGIDGEVAPDQLIGLDPRQTNCLVFNKDD